MAEFLRLTRTGNHDLVIVNTDLVTRISPGTGNNGTILVFAGEDRVVVAEDIDTVSRAVGAAAV